MTHRLTWPLIVAVGLVLVRPLAAEPRNLFNEYNISIKKAWDLNFYKGRAREASRYAERAVELARRKVVTAWDLGYALHFLGGIYMEMNRFADAEAALQEAILIHENVPDRDGDGRQLIIDLQNLGSLYVMTGRYSDAEAILKRSIALGEEISRREGSPYTGLIFSLSRLAEIYKRDERYELTEVQLTKALGIADSFYGSVPDRDDEGKLYNRDELIHLLKDIGSLYNHMGRYQKARQMLDRARSIPSYSDSIHAGVLFELGNLHVSQGEHRDAEVVYKQAISLARKEPEPNLSFVSDVLNSFAVAYRMQSRWGEAVEFVRAAVGHGYVNRSIHLSVLWEAKEGNVLLNSSAVADSFGVAQQAAANAASVALWQLAVRVASGSDPLAQLVRKEQDLSAEQNKLNENLAAAFSTSPDERNANLVAAIRKRLKEIAAFRSDVRRVLAQRFPEYAALSKPQPLAVGDVSSLLSDDEALVLIDLGKGKNQASYIWVVDRSGAAWKTIDAKSEELEAQIAALRASLDPDSSKPFDAKLAYKLYKSILGPVEDRIAKKPRLLMVMNGALTSLPPQVLVTADPAGKDLKSTDWLIRRHAIAILPSVYSLKILRGKQATGSVPKPLIGFGDPVFGKGRREIRTTRIASTRGYDSFYRAGTADLDVLARALPPLPDTAIELRAVAKSLGASETDLKLGSAATVTAVKQTKLDQYRIVYFATHALVSGETEQAAKGLAEPALVLSLPATATALDDGLLTASEAAQLKLNADWVVLSACNTAAAAKPGAEALSGLARAFFYAGARALLVSHWPVESDLATKLMTTLFANLAANPKLTTAEALRQAMLSTMNDRTHPEWANPSSWAPFVLVGEGGIIRK